MHTGGVVLELEVHELLKLGEGHDFLEAFFRLTAGEAEHDRVDDHVVTAGELGVEADPELDEWDSRP